MSAPAVIERERLLGELRESRLWDVVIIGGGATGLGIAVDAAARGFRTALIEARDFASGTSSRSTKLVHGGVRYLGQGNLKLVREALLERALLLANAPALVRPLKFVVPCYRPLEREVMRVGLGVYDALAGERGIGDTHWLSCAATVDQLPGVKARGLRGGVAYWDAQFDDARLAIALMRTAVRAGGVAINYVEADRIEKNGGRVTAVVARDVRTGERFELRSKVVFNATGVWADDLRRRADDSAAPLTATSRGSHIVLPSSFLPGTTGMMIPRTADGRVLFAIPWHGRLMVGTTDVAASGRNLESRGIGCRSRVHSRHRAQLPAIAAFDRRRVGDVRGTAAVVLAARRRGSKGNQDNLARARHRDRAPKSDHRDRRQVDHLSQDGAGCTRSGCRDGTARCAAVHDRRNEAGG